MDERFTPYDAATFIRDIVKRREAKMAAEAAQTAQLAQNAERKEAEGDPISPYGPEMSKLVNPRIR